MIVEWTLEDADNFSQFVAEHGGHIRAGELTWAGGWIGQIELPPDAPDGWGQQMIDRFEQVRLALRQELV